MLSDGDREILDEANRDAYECEMAMMREEQGDDYDGGCVSPEAERDLCQGILDEMEGNEWVDLGHVGDDDEECPW